MDHPGRTFALHGAVRPAPIRWWLAPVLLVVLGCAAQPASSDRSDGHIAGEMTVSRDGLFERFERRGDYLVSPVLDAPRGASRVGVMIELGGGGSMPALQAKAVGVDGARWTSVRATWSEDGHHVGVAELGARATGARLRVPLSAAERIRALTWNAVVPRTHEPEDETSIGRGRRPLRRALRGLDIVPREEWDARPARCGSPDGARERMAVHYTVTPADDPAARVRSIQRYHMDSRGWCDIGYHFLVGADGRVYEGRRLRLRGAHVGGHNSGNIGIAFIGCFHSSGCEGWGPHRPPEAMLDAGGRLIGTLSNLFDIPVTSDLIKGHRDHRGASTSCPGDFLHARLGDLRETGRHSTLADGSTSGGDGSAEGSSSDGSEDGTTEDDATGDPAMADCEMRACGECEADPACSYCASRGGCIPADDAASCTWRGDVAGDTCWEGFWPCWHARCWNPDATLRACDRWSLEQNFSSGAYSVHRYWTRLLAGGPTTIRLERTAGDFAPALLVMDRGGDPIYGGGTTNLHSDVTIHAARSGRSGDVAEVTLEASRDTDVFVYVTGWRVVDDGFGGSLPRDVDYRLTAVQDCTSGGEPAPSSPHAGLSQEGSEIPREGLHNPTLERTLGPLHEPYGEVVEADGRSWVRGSISWFGGPEDTSIDWGESGALTDEPLREMNDPVDPSESTLAARPEEYYYAAMRWSYSPNGASFWRDARIIVRNPSTGAEVVVRPIDWGPHTSTGRIIDLSPQTLADLGLHTDDAVQVAFAAPGTPLGPVE